MDRGRFSQSILFFIFFNASDEGLEVALSKRPSHENSMGPLQGLSYKESSNAGTTHRLLHSTLHQLLFLLFFPEVFSHSSATDTWWFCMNEARKSKFRHTSFLSSCGSHKYLQKYAALQPPPCLEGIPPGSGGPALPYGGKPIKYSRNLPDSQKCLLLCLQDWSVFSPSLLFSYSRAQTVQDLAQSSRKQTWTDKQLLWGKLN